MLIAAVLFSGLLGGYLFVRTWHRTRYTIAHSDGQHLYFNSAFYGAISFFLLAISVAIARYQDPEGFYALGKLFSKAIPLSLVDGDNGNSALSMSDVGQAWVLILFSPVHGLILARVFNVGALHMQWLTWRQIKRHGLKAAFRLAKRQTLRSVILRAGDDFTLILLNAMRRTMPIMIDTQQGRVYVGWVVEMPDPESKGITALRILPVLSGYRDEPEKKVVFTTSYDEIYQSIVECRRTDSGKLKRLEIEDFEFVLPMVIVTGMKLFDPDAFAAFPGNSEENSGKEIR